MADAPLIDVPIGVRAGQWVTVPPQRTVLVVAHNITTVTRLLDILSVFDSDFRVQVVVTWSGSDPFHRGLQEVIDALGIVVVPWAQAVRTRFDVAIAASHHGGLTDINAPLVILSHEIGYTKYSPGNRKPETGNRKPETGNRQTFGLSPQWLLYDGQPIAEALVLSHPEQLHRLEAAVPEAAHTAVIAGDPCYDRMRASLSRRTRYRRALGTGDHRRLIAVSSTWSPDSLLGSWPDLLRQLLAELPVDEYQVVAIAHPNTWQGHGAWQLRTWLADCTRAGLVLVPPVEGWRAALIAADCVIGDNGATTCYGAALGRPTLLAAFPGENVAVGSAVDLLGRTAPRLDPRRSLRAQVEQTIDDFHTGLHQGVAELVTSVPDESPQRLRALFYRVMRLAEPIGEPMLEKIPTTGLPTVSLRPTATLVEVVFGPDGARLVRYPAEVQAHGLVRPDTDGTHLVSHVDHPGRALRAIADILFVHEAEVDEEPAAWLAEMARQFPERELIAVVGDQHSLVRTPDGRHVELRGAHPDGYASVVYTWLTDGRRLEDLAPTIVVRRGQLSENVSVRVW